MQVCGGLAPAQSCTPLPLYKCGSLAARANGAEGVRESVAVDAVAATDTVSQRRVAIEVAGLAVWAEALPETKLTDEQVPFPLSTPASAGRWIRVPSARIFPSAYIHSLMLIRICPLCPPVDGVDKVYFPDLG